MYSRRQALGLLAALGGAAAGGVTVSGLLRPGTLVGRPSLMEAGADDALARFTRNLDLKGVEILGRAYLNLHPDEANLEALLERILTGSQGDEDLNSYIRSLVRDDYELGRVLSLDGWRLSETEGRVLAAVALSA